MHDRAIMELKGLCLPVGLIASLVVVFYCFGVFEVNELTTLSREPLRAQSAPITRVAAPPRTTRLARDYRWPETGHTAIQKSTSAALRASPTKHSVARIARNK